MTMMINGGSLGIAAGRLSHPLLFFFSLLSLFVVFDGLLSLDQIMMIRAEKTGQYDDEAIISVNRKSIYVVYMGAVAPTSSRGAPPTTSSSSLREDHLHLLASVLHDNSRKQDDYYLKAAEAEKRLVHSYRHGFSGFAALLSKEEARAITKLSARATINGGGVRGIVSVFEDPVFQLHTTRSWDFLQLQTDIIIDDHDGQATSHGRHRHLIHSPATDDDYAGNDAIIGILDTAVP